MKLQPESYEDDKGAIMLSSVFIPLSVLLNGWIISGLIADKRDRHI